MTKILVIDDNQAILNFLKLFLLQSGKFDVEVIQDSTTSFSYLASCEYKILLLDMDMPNVTGIQILDYIKKKNIDIKTIVLTGVEDIDLAISAMKLGTFDYMLKPIDEEKLLARLDAAIKETEDYHSLSDGAEAYSMSGLKRKEVFKNIITNDDEMIRIFHLLEKYAVTDNSILIWGESGTGKELIARAIHDISHRKDKKFIAVNAGAFANDLFASEFFGHAKGAFTGALSEKKGFIEEAEGGTLFLDEIGELTLPIQVKLLRFLQEEEFYRLGSTKNMKADVRIIAATNKNLFEEINEGRFRKDLFFRLNINSIHLPPLRERKNDIHLLAFHFLEKFSRKYNKKITGIGQAAMNYLKEYPFLGNVRELMNIINSAIIVESTNELKKKSLPNYILENSAHKAEIDLNSNKLSLHEIEKDHILKILQATNDNRSKAAKILGISRVSLISKIKKYEEEK